MNFNFKVIVAILIFLYAIITLLFFNLYSTIAIKDTKQQASYILDNMLEIRNYINNYQRPGIFKELEQTDQDGTLIDPTLLSANFMISTIYQNSVLKNNIPYEYRLASSNPFEPIYKTTKFEEEILSGFREDESKKEYTDIITENGKSYFLMAKPIERNTQSCLQCHGDPSLAPKKLVEYYGTTSGFYDKVGDLKAMLYVKIAITDILASHKEEFFWGGLAMFLAFIVIVILIYIVFQKEKNIQLKKESLFQQQNRLAVMGNMIGNISHQLKQPLTHLSNIFINLELQIEMKKLTQEKIQNKITDANEQIHFMSDTIDDFRNFFQPKDSIKSCSIDEIIQNSIRLYSASLINNHIKVEINIKDNFVVYAPKNEIIQIFINIISNAKDAFILNNISNRVIKIDAFINKNKNIVTIQNNGGNIDEAIIKNIFDAYFTTKSSSGGTGIGLNMSKSIMKTYKGTISAKNENDGVIFTLIFSKNNTNIS